MSDRQRRAARRFQNATVRVENQPYDFVPRRRLPRTGGSGVVLWCVPSSSMSAGTNPPSGAPAGPLTGQTIYQVVGGQYKALTGTYKLYNPRNATVTAGKLTAVTPNADDTFSTIDWDC